MDYSYSCGPHGKRILKDTVIVDPAFVALRFESRDWRSLAQYSFQVDLQNGL